MYKLLFISRQLQVWRQCEPLKWYLTELALEEVSPDSCQSREWTWSEFDSLQEQDFSSPQPDRRPNQWVPGALSLGYKRPESKGDYSPPSSVDEWNAPISPHDVGLRHRGRDNFTFIFYFLQQQDKKMEK
jgi:hypothetical protein